MITCFCCDKQAEPTQDWTETESGWICPECRQDLADAHKALNGPRSSRIPLEKVLEEFKGDRIRE